jgi:hypothetical protein
MVRLQNNTSAPSAVPAAGTALGSICLAQKGHASFAAMARSTENFDFINKHGTVRRDRQWKWEQFGRSTGNKKGEAYATSPDTSLEKC